MNLFASSINAISRFVLGHDAASLVADQTSRSEVSVTPRHISIADRLLLQPQTAQTLAAGKLATAAALDAFRVDQVAEAALGGGPLGLLLGADLVVGAIQDEQKALENVVKTVANDDSHRARQMGKTAQTALDQVAGIGQLIPAKASLVDAMAILPMHAISSGALKDIARQGGADIDAQLAPLRARAAEAVAARARRQAAEKAAAARPVYSAEGAVQKAAALTALGESSAARQALADAPVSSGADVVKLAGALKSTGVSVFALDMLQKWSPKVTQGADAAALATQLEAANYFSSDIVKVLGPIALNLKTGAELGQVATALSKANCFSSDMTAILKPAAARLTTAADVVALAKALDAANVFSSNIVAILKDGVRNLPPSVDRAALARELSSQAGLFSSSASELCRKPPA